MNAKGFDLNFSTNLPESGRTLNVGRPSRYGQFIPALKENPGVWARIGTDVPASTAGSLKRGKTFTRGEFEFASRAVKDGRAGELWARYIGENGEHR